jgi:hypothetical protein
LDNYSNDKRQYEAEKVNRQRLMRLSMQTGASALLLAGGITLSLSGAITGGAGLVIGKALITAAARTLLVSSASLLSNAIDDQKHPKMMRLFQKITGGAVPEDVEWNEYMKILGIGAVCGLIGGSFDLGAMELLKIIPGATEAVEVGVHATAGCLGETTKTMIENFMEGKPLGTNLLKSMTLGTLIGSFKPIDYGAAIPTDQVGSIAFKTSLAIPGGILAGAFSQILGNASEGKRLNANLSEGIFNGLREAITEIDFKNNE